jgi:hypothetical protein
MGTESTGALLVRECPLKRLCPTSSPEQGLVGTGPLHRAQTARSRKECQTWGTTCTGMDHKVNVSGDRGRLTQTGRFGLAVQPSR